ncbi:unnamed protein product [marine sediment metagenome]|uniref:Uncharacterized protein n=1 Tax=marine sediment metagenome TaxID=412755 RepID=X0Z0A9_9ZZZZ
MTKLPRVIEERIERRERRGRHIRTGKEVAISYPSTGLTPEPRRIESLIWNLRYMLGEKISLSGSSAADEVDPFTITHNKLTISLNDDTGSGVFDGTALTYTDSGETWTENVWANFYLKVAGIYYKILSNTADVLTLDIVKGTWIDDTTYAIVPFIPAMLVGGFLNPNTSKEYRFLHIQEYRDRNICPY